MEKRLDPKIDALIREFKTIKESLSPVVEEIKKVKETKIEIDRMKKDFDSRIRKLDIDIRKLSRQADVPKEIAVLKDRITRLSKDINSIHSSKGHGVEKEMLSDEIKKESNIQKTNITKLKNQLDEMNKNHLKLISSNRIKSASLISEFQKLKDNDDQLVKELNKHKQAILKIKDQVEKHISQIENLLVMNSKVDKKQSSDIGDVKNRIYKVEKKMLTANDLVPFQKSIDTLKEKIIGEVGYMKQRVQSLERKEETLSDKSIKKINKDIDDIKSHVMKVVKDLDRIDIKVNNTSKIIGDMEKVL